MRYFTDMVPTTVIKISAVKHLTKNNDLLLQLPNTRKFFFCSNGKKSIKVQKVSESLLKFFLGESRLVKMHGTSKVERVITVSSDYHLTVSTDYPCTIVFG